MKLRETFTIFGINEVVLGVRYNTSGGVRYYILRQHFGLVLMVLN